MEALKYNIRVLTYHGLYDDKKKEYPSLKTLIFSAVLILIVTFEAGSFSDLFITTENLQDFTNALLMFLAGSSSMMKMLNFYHQKHLLRAIIQDLNKHICHPRSLEEKKICRRSIIIVQGLFIVIFTFGYITVATALIAPFVSSEEDIKLPYPMFSFMNLANKKIFASLYVIELLVCVTIIPILTTADTLVYGMFILISEQYELLAYRLNHVAMSENCGEAIDRCIEHHSLILEIVSKVKKLLMGIISYFFGTCVVNLCFTILQMSMAKVGSVEFFSNMNVMIFILNQLFFHCWFGNDIVVKSQSVVESTYLGNWLTLNVDQRRKLIMLMMLSRKGSRISFHGQISMTIPTFILVCRASYGAYNLLHQSGSKDSVSYML